jgi:riboflavin transporter FmnP
MTNEPLLKNHWLVPLILVLASYPVWLVLTTSPILLAVPAILAAFWILTRNRQYFLAGLLTGLCLFQIEYLPFLAISGLILGRLRYLAGISSALIALFSAAQFIPDLKNALSIPALLSAPAVSMAPAPNLMQNFSGLLLLLLGEGSPHSQMASLTLYIVIIVAVTELWWRMHNFPLSQNKFLKKSSITILMMLIASPHTYIQNYVAVIPVAIWLWQATANDTRNNAKTIRITIAAFPILSWVFFAAQSVFLFLRLPPFFLWATALAVLTLPTLDDEKI